MWRIIKFQTAADRDAWIERNGGSYQWHEVFINQANLREPRYALEVKKLRIIG